jgi:hypothetical protein
MSDIQWSHTLHISLNQVKLVVPVSQIGASSFGCNDYILNSDVPIPKPDVPVFTG